MTYAELIEMSLEEVRAYAMNNPNHIGAQNALGELERQEKSGRKLARVGRRTAIVSGITKFRFSHSGPRCPTKRELQ